MKGRISAFLLAALMATMSMTTTTMAEDSGRQMDDIDCSGYTFEDLFEYNNAVFEFQILDDWATSDLFANSWVNESRAAVVRDNLDSLFEGFPGGDNDWISTDERDAVREIGAKCIADMYTRIGIREGMPHRGGVDWNDVEFVEDGIGLEEVNLIPDGHPEERSCAGRYSLASADCREVPTAATNNLEISMFTKSDETHNTRFNKLANSGESDFTVAMNATNVTSATMVFTFPFVDGMRMANWTIQDQTTLSDGTSNVVENLNAGSIEEIFLPDGSVRVKMTIGYDKADWPMIRNVFFDMTTSPPETNDVPVWTSNEPVDGTIIPILRGEGIGNEVVAITDETMADWALDNDAWGLDCEFANGGWSSRMNSDGELLVTTGNTETSDATCHLVDPYGAMSNVSHTWRFGQPAVFDTVSNGPYTDSVEIKATNALMVENMALSINAIQGGSSGVATLVNLGSTSTSGSVSLSGISPGDFNIHIIATSPGMLDWHAELDIYNCCEKKNTPPVLMVNMDEIEGTYATWSPDQYSFSLSGTAIDPDGGSVQLSAVMCDETQTSFTTNGDNWDVTLSIAQCVADGLTEYNVIISATDSVGAIATADINVPGTFSEGNNDQTITTDDEEESGLPSIGIFATVISMLGAAVLLRRD
ncbi:hypothetical protein OAO34_02385 [Candidatus Poseidoniaceae archaeon]|nr:hypothetical protein [Candidatus Poseidoniaceae archaeon]